MENFTYSIIIDTIERNRYITYLHIYVQIFTDHLPVYISHHVHIKVDCLDCNYISKGLFCPITHIH